MSSVLSSSRIRAVLAILTLALAISNSPRVRADADGDYDGIDDGLEAQLAASFFPTIYYQNSDNCIGPDDPRPVLFRARHPSVNGVLHPEYMLINYVLLYSADCGFNGHQGDNEPFEIFLKWNGSGWQFESISATAHWDDTCETWTSSGTPNLWVGGDKHGTYASSGACGCFGGDSCSGPLETLSHALYNVGEPDHHLINYLGNLAPGWVNQQVWDDDQFLEAGRIRDQLYNDRFFNATPTPEALVCSQECDDRWYQCNYGGYDERCDIEYRICNEQCTYNNRWDR